MHVMCLIYSIKWQVYCRPTTPFCSRAVTYY